MKTVDCYRPGCYCTMDHQIENRVGGKGRRDRRIMCPRCKHNRLVIGRLRGDL